MVSIRAYSRIRVRIRALVFVFVPLAECRIYELSCLANWYYQQLNQSAISALVSQYLGKDNLDGIKALPMQAMYVNVSISLLVLVISLAFKTEIFTLMNASGPLLEMCAQYFSIRIWGFPLTLFTFGVFGVFRGLQNTLWPMLVALTGAFLNIGLDFILVYGIEGFIEPMFLEGRPHGRCSCHAHAYDPCSSHGESRRRTNSQNACATRAS